MNTTIKTSRGPVRFHSIGEPIAGIPAGYYFNGDRTITRGSRIVAKAFVGEEFPASEMVDTANSARELRAALEKVTAELSRLTPRHEESPMVQQARAAIAKAKGVQS